LKRYIDEPLPFRILTIAALIAGYLIVYRPAETHLALVQSRIRNVQADIAFGETLLTKQSEYERAAETIRRNLSGMTRAQNRSALTASFLEDVANKTRDEHITLAEVAPTHTDHGDDDLTLHVYGPYKSVVGFMNDLNGMHTLVRLDALKITRLSGDISAGQTPSVDAAIDVALLPLQSERRHS
jgi:hypothetical protein